MRQKKHWRLFKSREVRPVLSIGSFVMISRQYIFLQISSDSNVIARHLKYPNIASHA